MRIAVVGKGGNGKTTLASLLALYLDSLGYRVGLVDADVNSHTADVVGVAVKRTLSESTSSSDIYSYLAGSNPRVCSSEMLNTTPPGTGSGEWTLDSENVITKQFGVAFGTAAMLFTVGSYKPGDIGVSCHHGNQSVFETMLSHSQLKTDDVLIIDSVAGNDLFGTTLFDQDLLVFIVRPERESVSVFRRFLSLAEQAGIANRVVALGNQCVSDKQISFLQEEIDTYLVGYIHTNSMIVDARLDDEPLTTALLSQQERNVFSKILEIAKQRRLPPEKHYQQLLELHKKVAAESWVSGTYRAGLEDQVDAGYSPL
jgi:CO dehydrogenase maturation factor